VTNNFSASEKKTMRRVLTPVMLLLSTIACTNASAQDVGERPAIHGMLMVGGNKIYLCHLPMFKSPHDYQLIVEADLGQAGNSVYLEDRKSHPLEKIYTLQPQERFILPDMIQNPRTFSGKIYRGHFERGGTPIAESVPVSITRVIYFRNFEKDARKAEALDYILFGSSREQFIAHLITAKPDFDQVLGVEVDNGQLKSAVEHRKHVVLEIPGSPGDRPVSTTGPVRAVALQAKGEISLTLRNPHEYYLEFDDLSH
jgi:hypothetical protein